MTYEIDNRVSVGGQVGRVVAVGPEFITVCLDCGEILTTPVANVKPVATPTFVTVDDLLDALKYANPSAVVCLCVDGLTYSPFTTYHDNTTLPHNEEPGNFLLALDPTSEVAQTLNRLEAPTGALTVYFDPEWDNRDGRGYCVDGAWSDGFRYRFATSAEAGHFVALELMND